MPRRPHPISVWRRRVYQVLDSGVTGDAFSQRLHRALIVLIVLNVIAVIFETVPAIASSYEAVFVVIETLSVTIFTIEYLARLWVAPEHWPLASHPPWKARVIHALSPGMIVDFLAILPMFLAYVLAADLRMLLLLRLLRFLKLARYSTGMRSLLDAIHAERTALAACAVILASLVLLSASFMHLAEHVEQPDKFGTIPQAMYWAVITLTTVGYGDVVPVTMLGKMIASITAVLGLGMLGLPVGILATAFAEVIHKRDFVVTWGMVARVPLFHGLDAETIAEIMRFLSSQIAQPGQLIVRRGEAAHSMYFITEGEVEVVTPRNHVVLGVGDFFGEVALLNNVKRSANVRARSRVSLLVLEKSDVHALMERRPDVARRIIEVAESRLPDHLLQAEGDLIIDEIERGTP